MRNARSLPSIMGRPVFLILNVTGIGLLIFSKALPGIWSMASATVGSALLTIGITLPVALYFQVQSNAEAFKILNTCSRVGIESIFVSRKDDAGDLREAIANAMSKTNIISLLGVAFRTFTDPSGESRETIGEKINSPSTRLRVLLLDPSCEAAERRAKVEHGNATLDDIRYTLQNNLVAIAVERLRRLKRQQMGYGQPGDQITWDVKHLRDRLNMECRTYQTEPVVFLMIFDETMFSEQYHRGRPDELVSVGSCIGKYMPMTQYRRGSTGFRFLECHFEALWAEATDRTDEVLAKAICQDIAYRSPGATEEKGTA